eukprot:5749419-Amphidinium_carterae.1
MAGFCLCRCTKRRYLQHTREPIPSWTVRTPGQKYITCSRCPLRELLTLDACDEKCLIVPPGVKWAIHELMRAQCRCKGPQGTEQHQLWQELVMPPLSANIYEDRCSELAEPDWRVYRREMANNDQDTELLPIRWCSPHCGAKVRSLIASCASQARASCHTACM